MSVPSLKPCDIVIGMRRVFGTEDPRFIQNNPSLCRYCPEEGDLFFVCGDTEYSSFVYHRHQWIPLGLRGQDDITSLENEPMQKLCTRFRVGTRHFVNVAGDPTALQNNCKLYPKDGDIYLGVTPSRTFFWIYFDALWHQFTFNTLPMNCELGLRVSTRTIVGPIVDISGRCEKIVGKRNDLFIVALVPFPLPQAYLVDEVSTTFYQPSGSDALTPIVLTSL